jgi:protein arginine N-methyltransferase 1
VGDVYGVGDYGQMIADRARTESYARALEAVVRPGCVVLDIGTGTGIFALLACRLGARRVYAVEPSDAIQVARDAARANGFADRVTFLQALSTRVTLPERAGVVVSDVRGSLPLFGSVAATLADARARHLAPGGVMLPRGDVLRAAPVEAPEAYARIVSPWETGSFGFDMASARRAVVNARAKTRVRPEQLLAGPAEWATLDYRAWTDPDVRGRVAFTAARGGTAHGVAMWFEADLADGIGYSSGPGTETIYQTSFFPFEHPVEVETGDRVAVELDARLVGDDYVWRWETRVERDGKALAEMRQSTMLSEPLSLASLRRRADSFRPTLSEDGRIDALALEMMGSGATLGQVARRLAERFPARFSGWERAMTHVGRLSERYAE